MAQVTSGKVLRETRERKGYDLPTVARRLRIRPDILRAIESNDFSAMPPKGYARNMINAYARLLGLNPTEIVNMYLDEAYAHQVERARNNAPSAGFDMRRESQSRQRSAYRYDDYAGDTPEPETHQREASQEGRMSRMNRRLYDDRTQYSRDDYGVQRERVPREDRSSRDFVSHHSGYGSSKDYGTGSIYGGSARSGSRGGARKGGYGLPGRSSSSGGQRRGGYRGRERQIHVGQTPMEYSAPRFPAFLNSRLPLLIAIAAVIVLVIVLVFFVFGRGDGGNSDDVSQLPVSGINDTTGTSDASDEDDLSVEVAPTSARIVYEVAANDQVYVEIYDDSDTATPEMISGPFEKTVETTKVWTITTYTPDLVKLSVNGEEVEFKLGDEYNGMYSYTVDFPTMLEEWRKTHTSKTSQRQAAVASAANAASEKSEESSSSSSSTELSTQSTATDTSYDATYGTTYDTTAGADEDYSGYYDYYGEDAESDLY